MIKIAASLLAAPPLSMLGSIRAMERAGVDLLHLDIMDGVFVPNISFGMATVAATREATELPLDVHLMITQPWRYVEAFAQAGASRLTVHIEACGENARQVLLKIKELGMAPGLSLRPDTPVEVLDPYLPLLSNILVMTVQPGFGGQTLMPSSAQKIAVIRKRLDDQGLDITVSVDGGVTTENAGDLIGLGADILVLGTGLVRAPKPEGIVRSIHASVGERNR